MKKPDLKALASLEPESDSFFKKAKQAQSKDEKMKGKTFTLPQSHIDYINTKSVQLSQDRGKNVPASEALRLIIEEYWEIKGVKL